MKAFSELYELVVEGKLSETGRKVDWSLAKVLLRKAGWGLKVYSDPQTRGVYFTNDGSVKGTDKQKEKNLEAFILNRVNPKAKWQISPSLIKAHPMLGYRTWSNFKMRIPYASDYIPGTDVKTKIAMAKQNKTRLTSQEEQSILDTKRPATACKYAMRVVKGRWPEGEPLIAQSLETLTKYATKIIKGEWLDGEKYFIEALQQNKPYAKNSLGQYYLGEYMKIKNKRWPELEPFLKTITERQSAWDDEKPKKDYGPLFVYASYAGIRIPWLEKFEFINDMDYENIMLYIERAVKKRWPLAEPILLKECWQREAIDYAEKVIKNRWVELEKVILRHKKNPDWREESKQAWNDYMKRVLAPHAEEMKMDTRHDTEVLAGII